MGPLDLSSLPAQALVLLDTPPIIYWLEGDALAQRFEPLFRAHEDGVLRFAISSLTIAEVLTGPLKAGDEAFARICRAALENWDVVPLDADIAETAARLRATIGLKLADAVQAASALAIGADALATYDRDFSRVKALRVIG